MKNQESLPKKCVLKKHRAEPQGSQRKNSAPQRLRGIKNIAEQTLLISANNDKNVVSSFLNIFFVVSLREIFVVKKIMTKSLSKNIKWMSIVSAVLGLALTPASATWNCRDGVAGVPVAGLGKF
ncbi:MAG: hypothetical protein R2874_07790 [Desulfobacterales bacterium]